MMALNSFALKLITHCCVTLAYLMHVKNLLRKINVCLKLVGELPHGFLSRCLSLCCSTDAVLSSAAQAGGKNAVHSGFVLEQL